MVLVVGSNDVERLSAGQTYTAMDDYLRASSRGAIRKLSAACMKEPPGLTRKGLGGGGRYEKGWRLDDLHVYNNTVMLRSRG